MLCVATAADVLALMVDGFELSWSHSVERVRWTETWEVAAGGLRPVLATVAGSGAGMEVPEGAVLRDGSWQYAPQVPPRREVLLAASGATADGWTLCAAGSCRTLGAQAGAPVRLWVADSCGG